MKRYKMLNEADKFPFPTYDGQKWFVNKFKNFEEVSEEEFNRRFSGGKNFNGVVELDLNKIFINNKYKVELIKSNQVDKSYDILSDIVALRKSARTEVRVYYKESIQKGLETKKLNQLKKFNEKEISNIN